MVWFAAGAAVLCGLGTVASVFAPLRPDPHGPFAGLSNPLPFQLSGVDSLLGIGLILGNGTVVVRWLRSRDEDRRAYRLLAVVAVIGFALPLLPIDTQTARVLYEFHTVLLLLVVMSAVLGHRLYGVDVALNRTLGYLTLSGLVAGVYGLLVGASVLIAGTATRLRHRWQR